MSPDTQFLYRGWARTKLLALTRKEDVNGENLPALPKVDSSASERKQL